MSRLFAHLTSRTLWVLVALAVVSCGESSTLDASYEELFELTAEKRTSDSPLVVFEQKDIGGPDAHVGEGVLRERDGCIYLDVTEDYSVLLLWPSSSTAWIANDSLIVFRNSESDIRAFAVDADVVSVGGSDEIDLARLRLLRPPSARCMTTPSAAVSAIRSG